VTPVAPAKVGVCPAGRKVSAKGISYLLLGIQLTAMQQPLMDLFRCLTGKLRCVYGVRKVPQRGPSTHRDASSLPSDGHDIISGLFASEPKAKNVVDEVLALQEMHRQVLEVMFPLIPSHHVNDQTTTKSSSMSPEYPSSRTRKTMDLTQASTYLSRYQEMVHVFPFVVLPKNWTVNDMLKNHPFLCLGIFCAMSAGDVPLNLTLDEEFRKVLSEKVIVKEQKSLDIFQGLLVYIAWYPTHINPRSNQLYQLLHMAIAIADEHMSSPSHPCSTPHHELAPKRAVLGCFYLNAT
jgi:hypothetical protein